MAKVLVLYQSSYGHMEQMANAAAEGARSGGAQVAIKRVPELMSEDAARSAGMKWDQPAPWARPQDLPEYDAVILGIPTRYGRMVGPMAHFWDQTGEIWSSGRMSGKVGAVMSSTATQHGGQEMTQLSGIVNLLHFGLIIVGLPYDFREQMTLDEIVGGSPYGASTIAGSQGQRQPSEKDLAGARYQGKRVAEIAAKLRA
ncbi:MAG TPA: NAD(P)H:quinone oxidoreductase [Steroidobacteraceae bacterium]|nr:NAD(P)H:quinone oxidoreductase [Steroidobacteraceae bacterium]